MPNTGTENFFSTDTFAFNYPDSFYYFRDANYSGVSFKDIPVTADDHIQICVVAKPIYNNIYLNDGGCWEGTTNVAPVYLYKNGELFTQYVSSNYSGLHIYTLSSSSEIASQLSNDLRFTKFGMMRIVDVTIIGHYSDGSEQSYTLTNGVVKSDTINNKSTLVSIDNVSQITYIGDSAFYSCTALTTLQLTNCSYIGSSAFESCTSLTSINDLSNCFYIGNSAFKNCSNLSSIGELTYCTNIGSSAFYNCKALTSLQLAQCSYIGNNAFDNCTSLTSINNLSNCTYIASSAFKNCSALISIDNLMNCSYIGNNAFDNCILLDYSYMRNTLPGTYSWINNQLSWIYPDSGIDWNNYKNIISITDSYFNSLPSRFNSIDHNFFNGCSNLTTVNLSNIVYIGNYAFKSCSSLATVQLTNCSSIGRFAFENCTALTSVQLIDCSNIGDYAFAFCTALTSVQLIDCSNIRQDAFESCPILTTVKLTNCSSIGWFAFENCSNLSKFILLGNIICSLGTWAFSNTAIASGNGGIYVLPSLVSVYKSAYNWSQYASYISGSGRIKYY